MPVPLRLVDVGRSRLGLRRRADLRATAASTSPSDQPSCQSSAHRSFVAHAAWARPRSCSSRAGRSTLSFVPGGERRRHGDRKLRRKARARGSAGRDAGGEPGRAERSGRRPTPGASGGRRRMSRTSSRSGTTTTPRMRFVAIFPVGEKQGATASSVGLLHHRAGQAHAASTPTTPRRSRSSPRARARCS